MTPHLQTVMALVVVALATGGLVWRAVARRRSGAGHEGCMVVSPDAKALRRKLKKS